MEVPAEQPSAPISDETDLENNPDWILDSLVAYLRGPVWLTPIVNFVEQNSVVFEEDDSEELEVEYQKIHDKFRNLVDVMLGAYMDDLGLHPEHLENALSQIQPSIRSAALQELLEPVQSAGDYERFKRLMRMKNEQLHNEALEILRKKHQLLNQDSADTPIREEFSEEEINEAIRQSLAEAAAARNKEVAEERQLDRALAASVAELLKTQQGSDLDPLPVRKVELDPSPITTTPVDDSADLSAGKGKLGTPDPEEVERRRAALRAQRDKLLSQKRKEHEIKLQQQDPDRSLDRPRSGRAAQAALAGEPTPTVDERTIQYRRLLLQKIKEEVEGPSK